MYSLGIPARNEQNNIEWLVESIFDQTKLPEEILICVNNSSDKTRDIVLGLSEKYPTVKLLESLPWKASAWNKIVAETKNKVMVFCDWDIRLWKNNSIEQLLEEFFSLNMNMLWASVIQLPSNRKTPYKLKFPSWQLYAINLESLWFSSMPNDTINEDLFLALKTYPNMSVTENSFFYCNKPKIGDVLITQLRILKGIRHLINLWMEPLLVELIKNKKNKYKVALWLSKIIPLDSQDHLWKEALSTKHKVWD